MFNWWRNRKRRRLIAKRKKRLEEAKVATELREFVYLDGTSVHSLLASRLGPIASEQTDVKERNWETKAAGKVGADLALFDVEGALERSAGTSQSSQVLKKSIVQTTFKDLLELEQEGLLLRCGGDPGNPVGVRAEKLVRGGLVELDVELDVEPVFRMATVVSSLVGIFEKSPELFGNSMRTQFAQGRAVQGILQAVLGGLVPIRARVLGYAVTGMGDNLQVVREKVAEGQNVGSLFLVGVAEQDLFWKDIRRVLFSRGRFRVLARIAQDGIRDAWTPIKLSHVLEEIIPGFSIQMNAESWQAMLNRGATTPAVAPSSLAPLLDRFIESVAAHAGTACQVEAVSLARASTASLNSKPFDFDTWRSETRRLQNVLLANTGVELSDEMLERLRAEAQAEVSVVRTEGAATSAQPKAQHFLDCEFVAIYW